MATRKNKRNVIASSGNVFRDLGLRNAEEKQAKVRLALAIRLSRGGSCHRPPRRERWK